MRIISWNIDGIKARHKEVKGLANSFGPDIILMQKVRGRESLGEFPIKGYRSYWTVADLGVSSGVAAYVNESLNTERIETPELSLDGHFQLFRIGGIMVGNAYVPYSNHAIPEAAELRRRWDEKLYEKIREMALGERLIVCGDFNVVHEESDSFDSKIVKKVPCFLDWERANFDRLIKDLPLTDTFRYLNPNLRKYSYFFRKEHRVQNARWRIDYALCSQALLPFVRRSDIIEDFGSSKSLPLLIDIQF